MTKTTSQRLFRTGALVLLSCLLLAQGEGVGANPQAQSAQAAAETVISYQGRLTNPSGSPFNTAVSMVFAI